MYEMVRMTEETREEAAELVNWAFARDGVKRDFATTFPQVFGKNAPRVDNIFGVYPIENGVRGEMCASITNYEQEYHVGKQALKIAVTGIVGTKSTMRGKGLMKVLFDNAEKVLADENFDISYLHGDRTRYNYFGYELCGVEYQFRFRMVDLAKRYQPTSKFTFVSMLERQDLVPQAVAVHEQQVAWLNIPEDQFLLAMRSSKKDVIGVFRDGEFWGSFGFNGDAIRNLALKNYEDFPQMVHEFLLAKEKPSLQCDVPDFDKTLLRVCMKDCGGWKLGNPANFRILNFPKVVQAFLQVKADSTPLCDGELTLDSDLLGKYVISVKNSQVTVEPFEGEAKYKFTGFEVYDFLFHHTPNPRGEYDSAACCWLPIPLYAPGM